MFGPPKEDIFSDQLTLAVPRACLRACNNIMALGEVKKEKKMQQIKRKGSIKGEGGPYKEE